MARLARPELELRGEVARKGFAQRVGLLALHFERLSRNGGEMVSIESQMHRVGACPGGVAGIAAASQQSERAGRERRVAQLEGLAQPRFQAARRCVPPAPAGEQQFERGEARFGAAAQQARDRELAVHQAASGTTRTPRLPRCRARMR